jgi:hypothetical protein
MPKDLFFSWIMEETRDFLRAVKNEGLSGKIAEKS